jgi:asparagine synthase (glutamine-hydrolysing)
MCGIAGVWNFDSAMIAERDFGCFLHSLTHRGPDGFGIDRFDDERMSLGHRRLSILDLSARGRQPMASADGRYWLTYNGEVFNYIELRDELRQLGYSFVSDTDSEVILAAFAAWGPACQLRFNGMWAFAIWDRRDRRVFLSRDRFGIKPLHYAVKDGALLWASEMKAFAKLPGYDGGIDHAVLAETLAFINDQEATEYTLLPGVKRLPGGHCMVVEADGSTQVERWWDTRAHVVAPAPTLAEQASQYRELFYDACRLRLRSDVTIGTSLSGGLDSSSVACAVARLGREGVQHLPADWQRAFVACFPGTNQDEEAFARQVVDHTGMQGHYYEMKAADALAHIDDIIWDFEAIYWVPLVGPWCVYREMRAQGVRVSMDGHGADEQLAGYHFFIEAEIARLLSSEFRLGRYLDLKKVLAGLAGGSVDNLRLNYRDDVESLLRNLIHGMAANPLTRMTAKVLFRLLQKLKRTVQQAANPAVADYPLMVPFEGERRLYNPDADRRYDDMSGLGRDLYIRFHHNILPTILRQFDRASMANGIEVRMPFMDWRLVTATFGLPDESKVGQGLTKLVLREAMKGEMPEPVRLRTNKMGFTSPLGKWLREDLREWALDNISSRSFLESDLWHGPRFKAAFERRLPTNEDMNVFWPAINAHALTQRLRMEASHHGKI